MKYRPLTPLRLVVYCVFFFAAHAALLDIMARTRVMEKVMAMQIDFWELPLILGFLIARFAVYLILPPVVVAYVVSRLLPGKRTVP